MIHLVIITVNNRILINIVVQLSKYLKYINSGHRSTSLADTNQIIIHDNDIVFPLKRPVSK